MAEDIIGVDPGETTGIAILSLSRSRFVAGYEIENLDTDYGAGTFKAVMGDFLASFPKAILVCEEFRLYPKKSQQLSWNQMVPAQVIGMLRNITVGKKNIHYQTASSIKSHGLLSDATLEALGAGSFGRHARDAARHALLWTIRFMPEHGMRLIEEAHSHAMPELSVN